MKPYPPMQRLTAAFLFLSFCLQSCIPSLKLGYVPPTKGPIHAPEALPSLGEQAHLVPTDSLKQALEIPASPNLSPIARQRLQEASANLAVPTIFPGVLPTQQALTKQFTPAVGKAEQRKIELASKIFFTTSSGAQVRFRQEAESWQAEVIFLVPGAGSYSETLPVVCQGDGNIQGTLASLAKQEASIQKYRIHVVDNIQPPYAPRYVYLGERGVKGGMLEEKEIAFPLHQAAAQGDEERVIALIETGKHDINGRDAAGYTPLQRAAQNGHQEVENILLNAGAALTPVIQEAVPISSFATKNAKKEAEEKKEALYPLHEAVAHGDMEKVISLIHQGFNVHEKDDSGATPYQLAKKYGNQAVVDILSDAGAIANRASQVQEAKEPFFPVVLEPFSNAKGQDSGATELGRVQREMPFLKKRIEEHLARFQRVTFQEEGLTLLRELTVDLEKLLVQEQLWMPKDGSKCAQDYIVDVRAKVGREYGTEAREQLTKLLERAYAQELKRVVSDGLLYGAPDKDCLTAVLISLAALHQEQGAETGELALYTDAATLYQHALSVCAGEVGSASQRERAYAGLAKIKQDMLARCQQTAPSQEVSPGELPKEIARDKQELEALREDAKQIVEALEALELDDEVAYIEGTKALFAHIAKEVRTFLARLYQEAEQLLGSPPFKYTVMGLGSMALQQMTPYSDLEFCILMEDNLDKEALAKQREYLRQLSHLVHFRVINLGETVFPQNKYGVSLDHLSKRGINFDLGGKTPLGRKDKPYYDLIQPVSEMLRYVKNEDHKIEHIDKLLPFILENTCYVHGDQALYAAYITEKDWFLTHGQIAQGLPVYKARALQKLVEGIVEVNYSNPELLGKTKTFQGNLAEFEPKFESEDSGRLYAVKQEIYRLPDRLLSGLAMYYGLLPENAWDAVDQLTRQAIIGVGEKAKGATNRLHYVASFATMLRLKTYLHHGQQKEGMSVLEGKERRKSILEMFSLPQASLQEGGGLFKYYYTVLPLHEKMKKFFETPEGKSSLSQEASFFQEEAFYQDSASTRGDIHQRLLHYESALACFEEHLKALREVYGEKKHPSVADFLNKVGSAYDTLGETRRGLTYKEEALRMIQALFPGNHPSVAYSLFNVGNSYEVLGDARKGLFYKEQALIMYKALFQGNHPSVAESLHSVGAAYYFLGDMRKAVEYFQESLVMKRALLPDNHPSIASSLNSIGSAYEELGEHMKALVSKEEALVIYKALYQGNHPKVAGALTNVGKSYEALEKRREGLVYQKESLTMYKALFQGNHHDVARSLNNVGSAYQALGATQTGLQYQEEALKMYKALFPDGHPSVAISLNNVGSSYQILGETQKALEYFEEALCMSKVLFSGNHPCIASYLSNMAFPYAMLGNYAQAQVCCEQALEILRKFYNEEHSEIYSIKLLLGIIIANSKKTAPQQLVKQPYQAAQEAYAQQDVVGAIHNYEKALKILSEEEKDRRRSIYHHLGCMHHVAFMEYGEQEHIDKATTAFEAAVAASDTAKVGLFTEYTNFLLNIGNLEQAYHYLTQAICSGDAESILSYGLLEKPTVAPLLQAKIDQDKEVQVRGIDYAFYLLIHHYEDFQQAGVVLDKPKAAYLEEYSQEIMQSAGKPGQEKEDETALYLLEKLVEVQEKQEVTLAVSEEKELAKPE